MPKRLVRRSPKGEGGTELGLSSGYDALTYNPCMLSRVVVLALAIAAATALGIAQAPQGAQSRGALGARPGAERKPEFPPPSIIDYKPRTTPVSYTHLRAHETGRK